MRLITQYSLLPFMTPRKFYYPRVVLQFYHSMTSQGVPSPLELRFTIDDQPGVLRAEDILAALGLPVEQTNAAGYRDWPQPTQREMVRCLARDTTAGPRTLPEAAPASDAFGGPPASYQHVPVTALRPAQESPYSRPCTRSQKGF